MSGTPDGEALEAISEYSRKMLSPDDVYTFSVVLCDNEIDRDCERFSINSLNILSEMFKGVTGIFDHSMKSSDQTARIYKTEVISDSEKTTSAGEVYTYLKAWCYMLRTDKNKDLISEIDGGIKKEISVSCSVSSYVCSICGCDMRSTDCPHTLGSTVDGKLCHAVLDNPIDAYEWSFVAVPAQRNAGVSKMFRSQKGTAAASVFSDGTSAEEIIKNFADTNSDMALTRSQAECISDYIVSMQSDAYFGKALKEKTIDDVVALSAVTLPGMNTSVFKTVLGKMSGEEVEMLKKAFESRSEALGVFTAQLPMKKSADFGDNSEFKI